MVESVVSPLSPPPYQSDPFVPEPDLHPLYPSSSYLVPLLAANSGLSPTQKRDLVQHSLLRACTFADLSLLSYLLADPLARPCVDLAIQDGDEDSLGLISTTILGFGGDFDRDVDREECVRLLVEEGTDLHATDTAGWSALHHAALLAPPTLVSFLLKHGASPFRLTRRGLTPLDILTAHSLIPGREAVAFLLEEAMRARGWEGGRMEARRRKEEERARRRGRRRAVKMDVGRVLGLGEYWWGDDGDDGDTYESESSSATSSEDEDDDGGGEGDGPMSISYSPPPTFTSMLVFSPTTLGPILDSLIYSATGSITHTHSPIFASTPRPTLRNANPARALYLLARFACIACDEGWLEDLMGGAVDRIERIVFAHPDHIPLQSFWLFNTTALLHLLRCDTHVSEICELLDLFSLLEGVIRAVYVFIIRIAERKIDPLLDTALLEHAPLASEFDALHFAGEWPEWGFLRSFAAKNALAGGAKLTKRKHVSTPPLAAPSPSSQSHLSSSVSLNGVNGASVPPSPGPRANSRPPSPSPSLQNFLTINANTHTPPNPSLYPSPNPTPLPGPGTMRGPSPSPSTRFSWAQSLTRARAASVVGTVGGGASFLQGQSQDGHMPSNTHANTHSSTHPAVPSTPNAAKPTLSLLHPSTPTPGPNTPRALTLQLAALHTLLSLAGINPALVTQMYSQVMYWCACEMFNRILTRKKYLCRSRALQIGMNLSVLEEWVVSSGLPHGVEAHFAPVRELLQWLQCLSSVAEFTTLVETIQTMRHLNPLQMRRAVRDYRYEVSETRMSEECAQYLIQLQKDWERRRVKLGVEALRREMGQRDHNHDGSVSSMVNDTASQAPSISTLSTEKSERSERYEAQRGIDLLFSRTHERGDWTAPSAPEALGELRDSRYMLPLVLPSDPRLLAAVPKGSSAGSRSGAGRSNRESALQTPVGSGVGGAFDRVREERSASRASTTGRGAMGWRSRGRKLRKIGIDTLEWVDGIRGLAWSSGGATDLRLFAGDDEEYNNEDGEEELVQERNGEGDRERRLAGSNRNGDILGAGTALTQKPRKPSSSRRGPELDSTGDDTAVPEAEE